MIKEVLFCFLIIHILCDFYLQPQTMADKKRKNMSWVLLHISVYAIGALIIMRIILSGLLWRYCILFVVSHSIIDYLKYGICNSKLIKRKKIEFSDTVIFVIDQILHLIIIGFIAYSVKDLAVNELYNKELMNFFDEIYVQETILASWFLKLILIHKPSNILISSILKKYRPKEKYVDENKNAGRFIGTLERIIMTILISINQYSAVGLVNCIVDI